MEHPLTGGCCCGNIQYTIAADPIRTFNCHCRTCQRISAAPYLAVMLVPSTAFNITGTCQEYLTTAASGNTLYRHFCPICGTPLFVRNSAHPTVRAVAAVTLDDPSHYSAEMDIWVADAQPWDCMNPNIPKRAGNF